MSLITGNSLESKLLETIILGRAKIPDDPDPGNYVVVDVAQFSTTVPELFANGAEYIYITEERGNEPAFKLNIQTRKSAGVPARTIGARRDTTSLIHRASFRILTSPVGRLR